MDNLYNEISDTLFFLDINQAKKLYDNFINVCNLEKINVDNIKVIGKGESSIVFEVDDKVLKISFIEYNNPSLKEYVSKSNAILQPDFEHIVNLGEFNAKIICTKKLSLEGITNEDVLNTYIKLRQDGYLWYDTKTDNIGKDENGNCFLIDYGELIYINDLDNYHKENELRSHKIKKSELDAYYNSIELDSNVREVSK